MKIKNKDDAFKAGYLVSSGTNISGEYYSSVSIRPPDTSLSAFLVYGGGGKNEDEALQDAFRWIEKEIARN